VLATARDVKKTRQLQD